MNNNNFSWRDKWRWLTEYCHREKSIFDIKDAAKALLLLIITCYCLFKLVEWLLN